eukprot:COSAG04_NODE_16448_length_498_cov_3.112782_2_plen_36_part_01
MYVMSMCKTKDVLEMQKEPGQDGLNEGVEGAASHVM